MTSFIDAIKNAEGTYEKYVGKKIQKRMDYLRTQIAAGDRLDGWSLNGAKKELTKLKKQWKNTFTEQN